VLARIDREAPQDEMAGRGTDVQGATAATSQSVSVPAPSEGAPEALPQRVIARRIVPMPGTDRFTLGGFLARFAFAVLVVGATYNPTRYSYYAWARTIGWQWRPPIVFVGVVLLIGWVVCLRLTLRSMGGIGLLLANAFLAALFWLVADWGWLPIENVTAISWIGLFSVATILSVGMSWSRLRRARGATPR
jgi:Family of unknown function (DUF6524)